MGVFGSDEKAYAFWALYDTLKGVPHADTLTDDEIETHWRRVCRGKGVDELVARLRRITEAIAKSKEPK
jgi:hypothetical protein